mmetsp:Transcript_7814/g.8963  ORF Transcript_7814/g.8963 Transcript_7814/m.8963 type:complete len:635 (-) Transcript_7814:422-2326(-)|eukprot:CAMPEP_0194177384 /NCGR_PEP_ID=MMETSP0154-20130528/11127_1 /TAXON_ID=1049557 /ORGANISM="Thalassiothrix antarctica, Strain L6-D1" /LENGTH=634 /DNA_ID=CAMNT_0038891917 /DNA_START=24 /DNA_END=1928 /DNA_ORIENTATION=-
MFKLSRFDPKEETSKSTESQTTQKKRKREEENSSLRVIATEAKSLPPDTKLAKLSDEALDDFDVSIDNFSLGIKKNVTNNDSSKTKNEIPKKISQALKMSTLTMEEAAKAWQLAPFLVRNLRKDGYKNFFPIQALVIPDIIASEHHSQILQCSDVCVGSPTGSGKTLAFCIPLLNSLAKRRIQRLRALVVLPSRDLASQVYKVFRRYATGSNIEVGLAIGQSDFKEEQQMIMVGEVKNGKEDISKLRLRHQLESESLDIALELFGHAKGNINTNGALDILVATPGRLIDHLDKTPGFSLQHLRFLVIDEADRLISQSYHSFIGRIMESVNSTSSTAWKRLDQSKDKSLLSESIKQITWRRPSNVLKPPISNYTYVCQHAQLRKLLFSATMTNDPQKLAGLGLNNPRVYNAHLLKSGCNSSSTGRYDLPAGLSESFILCTAEQKPLILLSLILEHRQKNEISAVFTSSVDSTHRLARLLQIMWKASGIGESSSVAEFSSALNQMQRTQLVQQCNETNMISVIVCSDGLSRGMDISSIGAVFNYDIPAFAKTYVHRCGRTARAGREGKAVSLLKQGQLQQFCRMRQLIEEPERVQKDFVKKELIRDAFLCYKDCVLKLKCVLQDEKEGRLKTTESL